MFLKVVHEKTTLQSWKTRNTLCLVAAAMSMWWCGRPQLSCVAGIAAKSIQRHRWKGLTGHHSVEADFTKKMTLSIHRLLTIPGKRPYSHGHYSCKPWEECYLQRNHDVSYPADVEHRKRFSHGNIDLEGSVVVLQFYARIFGYKDREHPAREFAVI